MRQSPYLDHLGRPGFRCADCRFYSAMDARNGRCHFAAPSGAYSVASNPTMGWGWTLPTYFCSEFRPSFPVMNGCLLAGLKLTKVKDVIPDDCEYNGPIKAIQGDRFELVSSKIPGLMNHLYALSFSRAVAQSHHSPDCPCRSKETT